MNFLDAYIECALWTLPEDIAKEIDGEPTLTEGTLEVMKRECNDFMDLAGDLLDGLNEEQAGQDFWLTRNGHGAGFWDRGLGQVGEKLTKIAKSFGSVYLDVGDDGKVYQS